MMQREDRRFFAIMTQALVAIALLSGCATASYLPLPTAELNKPRAPYRLDVGDKVRVTVYREPELSGEFSVGGTGSISLPLLGEVPVKGMTGAEVEAAVTQRFANGLLRDPRVSVDIYDVRTFAILGEVQRPGVYPAKEGTTLTDAVAMAGGYTYRANEQRILLRRENKGPYYSVGMEADVRVQPGDAIRVEEVHF
jgi:polysaccharide export outer membrane protein